MGMDRLLEYLGYLRDWPPAHITLANVHREKDSVPVRTPVDAKEESRDLGQLAGALGARGKASCVPPRLRKLAADANELQAKLKKGK